MIASHFAYFLRWDREFDSNSPLDRESDNNIIAGCNERIQVDLPLIEVVNFPGQNLAQVSEEEEGSGSCDGSESFTEFGDSIGRLRSTNQTHQEQQEDPNGYSKSGDLGCSCKRDIKKHWWDYIAQFYELKRQCPSFSKLNSAANCAQN